MPYGSEDASYEHEKLRQQYNELLSRLRTQLSACECVADFDGRRCLRCRADQRAIAAAEGE